MEIIDKKKLFVQLQFCLLLLACSMLPDFGNIISSAIGMGGLSVPVIIARIIGVIGGGFALYKLYKGYEGEQMPIPYLCIAGGGLVLSLITLISGTPMWLDYVTLILLFVGLYMGKKSLEINWLQESTQGAYLILLATLIQLYYSYDDKISTSIANLVGLIIYIVALGKFKRSMDESGVKGVSKLKAAAWIGIIGSAIMLLVGWIPLLGTVVGVLVCIFNIVAFILQFIGYGNIAHSATVGSEGQAGAGKLRISMILAIIGAVLSAIPVVGVVGGIVILIALFLVFQGWTKIIFGLEQEQPEAKPAEMPVE